jgi:hypothetical protein
LVLLSTVTWAAFRADAARLLEKAFVFFLEPRKAPHYFPDVLRALPEQLQRVQKDANAEDYGFGYG